MEYVQFGKTGMRVSALCLGCMNFGGPTDEETSIRIIHAALDAGINFIDTANVYANGRSEEAVGVALADGRRARVVLATKVHFPVGVGPNQRGNSRRHIMEQVDASLRRLRTDWLDLYQIHRPDPGTSIDETLRALDDLVRAGKVRYLGSSTFPAWQLCEAQWVANVRRLDRFASEQPPYSIFRRGVERDVLPFCSRHGIAVMPWSPLEAGWLSGKYRRGEMIPEGSRLFRRQRRGEFDPHSPQAQHRYGLIEQLLPIAEERGCSLSQFALAWCRANPAVTAPIIGPRTEEHLMDNLGALAVSITDEDRKAVDEIVPPGVTIP